MMDCTSIASSPNRLTDATNVQTVEDEADVLRSIFDREFTFTECENDYIRMDIVIDVAVREYVCTSVPLFCKQTTRKKRMSCHSSV